MKYAAWEESQNEFERARSVYERCLDVDYRKFTPSSLPPSLPFPRSLDSCLKSLLIMSASSSPRLNDTHIPLLQNTTLLTPPLPPISLPPSLPQAIPPSGSNTPTWK